MTKSQKNLKGQRGQNFKAKPRGAGFCLGLAAFSLSSGQPSFPLRLEAVSLKFCPLEFFWDLGFRNLGFSPAHAAKGGRR
ncbi:MAG: hypothetical protein LBM92_01150 [Opitutaceae bacterium]|nr:hypothetical protein [Opitutaceae bacterium]